MNAIIYKLIIKLFLLCMKTEQKKDQRVDDTASHWSARETILNHAAVKQQGVLFFIPESLLDVFDL